MTELKKYLLDNGVEKTKEKIAAMDSSIILAELDDTIQFDLLKLDTDEWAKLEKKTYNLIIRELAKRLS